MTGDQTSSLDDNEAYNIEDDDDEDDEEASKRLIQQVRINICQFAQNFLSFSENVI